MKWHVILLKALDAIESHQMIRVGSDVCEEASSWMMETAKRIAMVEYSQNDVETFEQRCDEFQLEKFAVQLVSVGLNLHIYIHVYILQAYTAWPSLQIRYLVTGDST